MAIQTLNREATVQYRTSLATCDLCESELEFLTENQERQNIFDTTLGLMDERGALAEARTRYEMWLVIPEGPSFCPECRSRAVVEMRHQFGVTGGLED